MAIQDSCGAILNMNKVNPPNKINLIVDADPSGTGAANLYVDTKIGKHPVRFTLDTGAASTTIMNDEFSKKFPIVGERSSAGIFTGKQTSDLVEAQNFHMGPVIKKSLIIARSREAAMGVNLLGLDILKDLRLHFVFEKNWVEVIDSNQENLSYGPMQRLELGVAGHIFVHLQWKDGTRATGVWDTGAAITFMGAKLWQKHPDKFQKVGHQSTATDSQGNDSDVQLYRIEEFEISSNKFGPANVAIMDLSSINSGSDYHIDFILGYNVLREANWYIDFPGRQWCITGRAT